MNRTIYKGMHYSLDFLNFVPYFNGNKEVKIKEKKEIVFTESTIYDIGKDQSDINKLFGFGYGLHHHIQSDRIGWRYNPTKKEIELFLYSYEHIDGLTYRQKTYICSVNINDVLTIELRSVEKDGYRNVYVNVNNKTQLTQKNISTIIKHEHTMFGYKLGLYFGGNQKAPHKMKIKIKKVP